MNLELTSSYDYEFNESLIAKYPIKPKENARLLVYDRKNDSITHTKFGEITNFIPEKSAIILNDTKVVKARIYGEKQSGGKAELLLNSHIEKNIFNVFIKAKVRQGTKIYFKNKLKCVVLALNDDGSRNVSFSQDNSPLSLYQIYEILEQIGHIPLPPYIKRDEQKSDESEYQSIFARSLGAVAAPTASLHFSEKMLTNLKNTYEIAFLTLHIGSGTFKPISTKYLKEHTMHTEFYEIPTNLQDIINSNKEILCVGTTCVRSVEYFYQTKKPSGQCDLFLSPLNKPTRVDHLLTNFHLPKSTLLMLVASFIGLEKTLELYKMAVLDGYRFYSYGDCMLVL